MRAAALAVWLGAGGAAAAPAPAVPGPPAQRDAALEWRAFRSFSSADGLPQNSVLALLQDRAGFLYAGTQQGVARYDGQRWQVLSLPAGGRSYAVGALAQAADGALLVGSDVAGAWRIEAEVAQPLPLPAAAGAVNAFWPMSDGRLWIAAGAGLYRCTHDDCTRLDGVGRAGARSLFAETREGQARLWVGTNDEGVVELLGPDQPQPRRSGLVLGRAQGLPNNVGLSIARFAGDLWIGAGRGLARWDGTRLQVYGAPNGFPPAMVFGLQEARDAQDRPVLYAALRPGGVAEISADGTWRVIDSRHGLPSNAVHSLSREQRRGALWLGTMGGGVARIEAERWALFDERMGLPDRVVLGVGWSAPGELLWAGTARGAVQWRDGRFVPLLPDTHAAQLVYDLLDAPDGTRWIAHGRGLQRWRDATLELDFDLDHSALPAVSVDRLAARPDATGGYELYAGTGHGLARWRAAEGLELVRDSAALAARPGIRALAVLPGTPEAPAAVLWVSSDAGLHRYDGRWQEPAPECLRQHDAFGLAPWRAAEGEVLFLATRDGLLRLGADGRCQPYPATHALGALAEVRLVDDALYVFGARGAMRLARDGPPTQSGQRWAIEAGLPSAEIVRSAVDGRGRIFGATAAGLAALQPGPRAVAAAPAPLRLRLVHAGRAQRPLQPGQHLPPDDSAVRFEFALLALEREHALRYRTRLDGLEAQFSRWRADGSLAYPHLPPGQYTLQIEARDADGVAAAPLSFAFAVDAPWWQRPSVVSLAALALLAAGLAAGRWRARAAQRRAAALEAEVAQRTHELAEANLRLEQAAVTDPLTGLKNRRWFALAAPAEAERARRGPLEQALLLALLDIDHFKRINDSHGHAAGDAVLAEVAQRLQQVARGGDFVLRWGGEEFLLLLRDVARSAAPDVLQRLLDALGATPVAWPDTPGIAITASIGALCYPQSGAAAAALETALAQADAALYRAKREGRDRAILLGGAGAASDREVRRTNEGSGTP